MGRLLHTVAHRTCATYTPGMSGTIHAFDFLDDPGQLSASRFYVLFGDDRYLQLRVKHQLLEQLAGGEADFDTVVLDGETAGWNDVVDELQTFGLFSQDAGRTVVVEEADAFVKKFRGDLEQLVANPPASGQLLLLVGTWASNTKLYKAIDKSGVQIHCADPQSKRGRSKSKDTARIVKWLVASAKQDYELQLTQAIARQLLDIVDWNLGQADQELAKLRLFAGQGGKVDETTLREVTGGWRAQSIWDAASAATRGDTDEALAHLANLLQSGEHPLALYGQLSWSLRRYGRLWEIISRQMREGRRADLSVALGKAGFRQWGGEMDAADASVRQLGRDRVKRFYAWLLETD
ncbi:MAG: DNA polymerase III subunit delta, partial [Pirellulaceae bacterium]